MAANIAGSLLLLVVAAILASVVVGERDAMPGWVTVLTLFTMVLIVITARRIWAAGVRHKQATLGPRTRLVLSDDSNSHPAKSPKRGETGEDSSE